MEGKSITSLSGEAYTEDMTVTAWIPKLVLRGISMANDLQSARHSVVAPFSSMTKFVKRN